MDSALYVGTLRHRRFRPRAHAFTYSLFMPFVDIDRVDDIVRVSRVTSRNRFNWASFDDRDHVGDPSLPLRERLRLDGLRHGHTLPSGQIMLLTHLRYLGYAFNPISFYYCFDASGSLDTIVGEVHSTFGEQCTYWLPRAEAATARDRFRLSLPKTMHVSPFMSMLVDYEFIVTPPGPSLVAHMTTTERTEAGHAEPYFDATLTLERRPWSAREIRGALVRHPWMTGKVIGAIHWEALRLWLKGVPSHPHPVAGRLRRRRSGQEANV